MFCFQRWPKFIKLMSVIERTWFLPVINIVTNITVLSAFFRASQSVNNGNRVSMNKKLPHDKYGTLPIYIAGIKAGPTPVSIFFFIFFESGLKPILLFLLQVLKDWWWIWRSVLTTVLWQPTPTTTRQEKIVFSTAVCSTLNSLHATLSFNFLSFAATR